MAVVREFTLPDLGEGLTEAVIVQWLVEVGEVVAVDQPVVEVETAKAMVEVPCPYGGVVTARFGAAGTEVPVGAPLVTVAVGAAPEDSAGRGSAPGSANGSASVAAPADSAPGAEGAGTDAAGSGNVLVGYGTSGAAARRRRILPSAAEAPARRSATTAPPATTNGTATNGTAANGTATNGTATGDAPGTAAADGPRTVAVISPLVRRIAREHDLDLRKVRGSGRDGLILRTDVESAVRALGERQSAAARTAGTADAAGPVPGEERILLKGLRGAAAEKFSRSRREIPDATCWVDADATDLLATRRAMNVPGAPKVSLLALLARICTAALARYPELNATVDTTAQEIVRLPAVHLGFAAQTDRGLVVPVVRDAQGRTVEQLSAEIARLTDAARAGKLSPAELSRGTFTLNNYGVFGVDGSTPILNHPEAAMLGVGRIAAKPWVHDGELAVREVVQLSFTFDHRVCDGGIAGGFLRYVADCVEQPALLLRSL
ncbi:2-oxo acid dehydrogenase subunit E2 [Streptomyces albulus]|uniref:dihydrolipoamide acetyltransferase family protein n=1 Tax=Streptomyces noursei TaxID=1971 RepID=UPI001F1B6CFE|nr:dihydrolipoamide acetyltransferase family protein [Streptomyces noursei]MCE4943283.1 2-oxo acid dehydrogenase subunit E2 [Streptomyces noursei]